MKEEFEYFENTVPGAPLPGNRVIGGLYKKKTHKCHREVKPLDLSKERMTVKGTEQLQYGVSIVIIALVVSMCFKNTLTNSLGNLAIGIGGTLSLLGLTKIFIAAYLTYFIWAAGISVLIGIIYRLRKRSICNSIKWIRSRINGNDKKQGSKNKMLSGRKTRDSRTHSDSL